MSDHYTCKRCLSHFSECECPSYNEQSSWALIKDDPNVVGLVKRGESDYLLVIKRFAAGPAFRGGNLAPNSKGFV
jgi:hypothetical protein